MRETIAGIILAGGLSRRMGGGDKPLARLHGRLLIEHVIDRLRPQVGLLAINANGDPARFTAFGLTVVADTVEGHAGPLAGVLAGLEWASAAGATRLLTAATDTPFFPIDLAERLLDAVRDRPAAIAVARSDGRSHPTFTLWPIGIESSLRHALVEQDERRVSAFIGQHEHAEANFALMEADGDMCDPFFNINTPQDLAEAERLARVFNP